MNKFGFFFSPLFPYWVTVCVSLLFVFFIWKEVKRNQRLLWSRIIGQIIILIAILGILLRPGFSEEKKISSIILLTPGFNKKQADSLLAIVPDVRVLSLEGVDFSNSEILKTFNDLPAISNEIAFVLGDGLPAHALELMTSKNFRFLPSPPPSGICKLQIPAKVTANQTSYIKGVIKTDSKTSLMLIGAGGREDSVVIAKSGAFELSFHPKQSGLSIYNLRYKDEEGEHTEQIPVEVFEEQKLNILFLQNSPGFELRQLKNFLAERGHKLSLRYQLSRNNYRVEFANTPSSRISPLTSEVLQAHDLVILNNDALESLSIVEKNILEKSIHDGLGLIFILNRATENDKARKRFFPIELKKVLKDTALLTLSSRQYNCPVVPLQPDNAPAVYTLSKNKSRVLSAYTYSGFGKVGVQFLQETYRIALEGNVTDYASIWSPLLEKTARMKREKFKIQVTSPFPLYPEEPLSFDVVSAVEDHPTVHDGQFRLPLMEHPAVDNLWTGTTWAGNAGWHTLKADGTVANYYVSEPTAWRSLRLTNQQLENTKVSVNAGSQIAEHVVHHQKTIPPFVYFLLFIFAAGHLWLAPKL